MQPPHLTPGLSLRRFAWLWLAAAAGVAVVRSFEPFDHGIWLVAYLALVGWLAQLLLGRGQAELAPAARRPRAYSGTGRRKNRSPLQRHGRPDPTAIVGRHRGQGV